MTAAWSFNFPNIVWTVGDITSHCEKKGPSFDFCGEKWTLKLIHCNHCDGERIQIFLKRTAICESIPEIHARTSTGIVSKPGDLYKILSASFQVTKFSKWCVWSASKNDLATYFGAGFNLYLENFAVMFTMAPANGWHNLHNVTQIDATGVDPVLSSESLDILNKDIGHLFNNHAFADVVLVCGKQRIYAHRAILSARSEVFAAMFRNDEKESKEMSVEITNVEPCMLEQLIRFMYSGEVPQLSPDFVYKMYAAADMYGLETLKVKCGLFMMNNPEEGVTSSDDVIPVDVGGNETLKDRVVSHFADIRAVIACEEWKQLSSHDPKLASDAFQLLVKRSPV